MLIKLRKINFGFVLLQNITYNHLCFITKFKIMKKLNEIAMFLYGKPYNDLEPHQQYDVQQTINNPDY